MYCNRFIKKLSRVKNTIVKNGKIGMTVVNINE